MPDLTHLHHEKGRSEAPPPSPFANATVTRTVPGGVMAIVPSEHPHHEVGPCVWDGGALPEDTEILLAYDEIGDPWVIGVKP